jgi:lysophospholipase L1-like esterase
MGEGSGPGLRVRRIRLGARTLVSRLALVSVSLIVGGSACEGLLWLLLSRPQLLRYAPAGVVKIVRVYFARYDRNLIQANPDCSRYDPGLTYVLRPGGCRFVDREFAVDVAVNSLGVRDDEASLAAPEIVFLGDSHTMGWGVEEAEAFPSLVEQAIGWRGLNAGVSSYGTVRELRLLERVDTSRLRRLVVQYSANDDEENRTFAEASDELPIRSQEDYQRQVEKVERHRRYSFGKITGRLLRDLLGGRGEARATATTAERRARDFVHAVERAGHADLGAVEIVVFELNAWGELDGLFCEALAREAVHPSHPAPIRRLTVLDLRGRFEAEDWFRLDGHPRPSAHRKIADALLAVLHRRMGSH